MSLCITFLGAPGSGKGTQSTLLARRLNMPKIVVGDWVREEVRSKSELGLKIASYSVKGMLVPDEIVIEMFAKRIDGSLLKTGFISDGFPRTKAQAEMFDATMASAALKVKVIFLDVNLESIKERLLGRLICSSCGEVYHENNNRPDEAGICTKCGYNLSKRDDDKEEVIVNRFNEFMEKSRPMFDYFGDRLIKINGNLEPEKIQREIILALKK